MKIMNDEELEWKIRDYIKENLSLEIKKVGGSYGSSSYKIIQLKLGKEIISDIYIDD